MYLTTNKCDGQGDCIRNCPSEAIRFVDNKLSESCYIQE